MELLLHGVYIGISILNQAVEEIGCLNSFFTVHVAVCLGTVLAYKVSAVGNPELLQHIGQPLSLIHDNVGSCHAAGGQLTGNISEFRPGQGILHLIRHGDAGRVCHIFIVVQCHGTLSGSQGVQLSVIGSLHLDGFHEITQILLCKMGVNGYDDSVRRVIGYVGTVHKQNVRQVVACHGRVDFILVGIGIRPHDGLPLKLDFSLVFFIERIDFFNPPCFNGRFIRGTPDGHHLSPVAVGPASP